MKETIVYICCLAAFLFGITANPSQSSADEPVTLAEYSAPAPYKLEFKVQQYPDERKIEVIMKGFGLDGSHISLNKTLGTNVLDYTFHAPKLIMPIRHNITIAQNPILKEANIDNSAGHLTIKLQGTEPMVYPFYGLEANETSARIIFYESRQALEAAGHAVPAIPAETRP